MMSGEKGANKRPAQQGGEGTSSRGAPVIYLQAGRTDQTLVTTMTIIMEKFTLQPIPEDSDTVLTVVVKRKGYYEENGR